LTAFTVQHVGAGLPAMGPQPAPPLPDQILNCPTNSHILTMFTDQVWELACLR
jgi:hypothetical protein